MSFKETTPSGQPKNIYNYPKELSEQIRRKMGAAEGFILFQHKLQFLENIIDALQVLMAKERLGFIVNDFDGKPIKTKIPMSTYNTIIQIWEQGGWLLSTYVQVDENNIQLKTDEYLLEYPKFQLSKLQELIRMPALHSMKSKDELSSEKFLLRIGEEILEREAYRWQDPEHLCENGKLEKERNGKIIPYFKSYNDIETSTAYTSDVPRAYYDTMTTIAWRKIKYYIDEIRAFLDQMAKEIDEVRLDAELPRIRRRSMESA